MNTKQIMCCCKCTRPGHFCVGIVVVQKYDSTFL